MLTRSPDEQLYRYDDSRLHEPPTHLLTLAVVGQVTPSMLEAMPYGTFIFFGAFSTLGGLFIWFLVSTMIWLAVSRQSLHCCIHQCPETKGLTLEEMDAAFGDTGANLAAEDRARQEAIHKRLGLDTFFDKEGSGRREKEDLEVHEKEHTNGATL